MPEPSQVKYPWRTTARTVFQLVIGLAAALPVLVAGSGLPTTAAGVGFALTVSAVITRLMADPLVNALLPAWLKAEPKDQ